LLLLFGESPKSLRFSPQTMAAARVPTAEVHHGPPRASTAIQEQHESEGIGCEIITILAVPVPRFLG
jgi:hypothetical protein